MSDVESPHDAPAVSDAARLAALRDTALLDTPAEEPFDRLTRLAAQAMAAPVALVSLIDSERSFFKSAVGVPEPLASARQTPLTHSLCWRVVARGQPLVVGDARHDPVLAECGAVRDLGVVAYAGVPLRTAAGHAVGTVCVVDTVPRGWTERGVAVLHDLAAVAAAEIERRRAEQAAGRSEERYRRLVELTPNGIIVVGADGAIRYANPAAARLLGAPAPAAVVGKQVMDFVHPDSRPAVAGRMRRASQDGAPVPRSEEKLMRLDGRLVVAEVAGGALRFEGEAAFEIVFHDVTERWHADEARRRSEASFRSFVEHAPYGIYRAGPDGALRTVNPALVRMLGYDSEDALLRVNLARDVYADPAERARLIARASHEGYQPPVDVTWKRRDGTPIVVRLGGRPVRDARGAVLHWEGFVEDVSEQARVAEALRATNEALRALITAAPVAVIARDGAGRVTLWNPAAERTFGWSEAEVVGGPLPASALALLPTADALMEVTVRGEVVTGVETTQRRKDGTPIDVSVSTALLRDAAGRATGTMAVVADITARKRLEERLHRSERLEAVGQLAAGVAHDFNNFLTVIATCSGLLLQRADEAQRPDLLEIQAAGRRAEELTRQLLDLGGRRPHAPERLDLNLRVAALEGMLRRLVDADVHLVTVRDPRSAWVLADTGQIDQVLMNLVVNARDAMPDGGVLTITTANAEIGAATAPADAPRMVPGRYVRLSVQDTGCGMDAATRARLFDPFFTTKPRGKGTGLGLATVYGIVTQAGGHVGVESAPGSGTTFTLHFPAVDGEKQL